MAKKTTKKTASAKERKVGRIRSSSATPQLGWRRRLRRIVLRGLLAIVVLWIGWILAYAVIPVPITPYMIAERVRGGELDYQWTPIDDIAPVLARSVVAAEDANFCLHWGFDMAAIRDAIESGGGRGASTISQQTVKNAFLWHGRSWPRKALEALTTPMVEMLWSKRRILEVYLNIAEFDDGVFGAEAASRHYFGVGPDELSDTQAARLAAILPSPKLRSAGKPGQFVQRRARQIADGAQTIRIDGRARCFED
ncbi:monofunctional biosynthetic peptidoglycan transglycosylase [Celeribacter marinus]|uniref:monofunctional biosynthetic peptidoglycan transglycosylase n=1 Tax=Celeribacter marinus TaxID=1397108 RepID=UPI00317E55FB